nr:putative ankyrin 2 [Tranosema rostrale ichnovirus]
MEISEIAELFGRNFKTGNTIFHDLAEDGALRVLYRIRDWIDGPSILQIKNYSGEFPIHSVVKWHRGFRAIHLIEVLVQMGADLNAKAGSSGDTVLHMTTYGDGDSKLAEWLCEQPQIDLNVRNYARQTAYGLAFKTINLQLMTILRNSGAKCETPETSEREESDDEGA